MAVTNRLRQLLSVGPSPVRLSMEEIAKTQKLTVISGSGATRVLTANDSGSLCMFDRAAGIVYTLPAPEVGLTFTFDYVTTITSNSGTVTTNAGTVFLGGSVISIDTDTANVTVGFVANGTSHVSCASNGTTTGGLAGSRLEVKCVTATRWVVSGTMLGNGVVLTPFA